MLDWKGPGTLGLIHIHCLPPPLQSFHQRPAQWPLRSPAQILPLKDTNLTLSFLNSKPHSVLPTAFIWGSYSFSLQDDGERNEHLLPIWWYCWEPFGDSNCCSLSGASLSLQRMASSFSGSTFALVHSYLEGLGETGRSTEVLAGSQILGNCLLLFLPTSCLQLEVSWIACPQWLISAHPDSWRLCFAFASDLKTK